MMADYQRLLQAVLALDDCEKKREKRQAPLGNYWASPSVRLYLDAVELARKALDDDINGRTT